MVSDLIDSKLQRPVGRHLLPVLAELCRTPRHRGRTERLLPFKENLIDVGANFRGGRLRSNCRLVNNTPPKGSGGPGVPDSLRSADVQRRNRLKFGAVFS